MGDTHVVGYELSNTQHEIRNIHISPRPTA